MRRWMCTAVVGGSIHRAARRSSAASNQTSATPMASHRTKNRRRLLRGGVWARVSGGSVTFRIIAGLPLPRSRCPREVDITGEEDVKSARDQPCRELVLVHAQLLIAAGVNWNSANGTTGGSSNLLGNGGIG